jgi:hypothetical protein
MITHCFRVYEYDPSRPWIILSTQAQSIELPDDQDFDRWARERFPDDRYRVLLDRPTERWPPPHNAA